MLGFHLVSFTLTDCTLNIGRRGRAKTRTLEACVCGGGGSERTPCSPTLATGLLGSQPETGGHAPGLWGRGGVWWNMTDMTDFGGMT